MRWLRNFLFSSIGRKQLVAVSGLLLCGFLVSHLAGNLLMLKSPQAFDAYSEYLVHHPLIVPAEIILAALFLAHILFGLKLAWENRQARPQAYAVHASAGGRTLGSGTMKWTGLWTLIFLILHIVTFRLQHPIGTSLFDWVVSWFKNALYMGFYLAAMLFLGIHLSHGFQSAFQTLGLNHPKYTPAIKVVGILFALAMTLGFGILPLWAYLYTTSSLP